MLITEKENTKSKNIGLQHSDPMAAHIGFYRLLSTSNFDIGGSNVDKK